MPKKKGYKKDKKKSKSKTPHAGDIKNIRTGNIFDQFKQGN